MIRFACIKQKPEFKNKKNQNTLIIIIIMFDT